MYPSPNHAGSGGVIQKEEAPENASRLQIVIDLLYDGKVALLADDFGVKPSTVYPYIQGTKELGAIWLHRLACRGINIHWIATDEGSMFAPNQAGRQLELHVRSLALVARKELQLPSNVTLLSTAEISKKRSHSSQELNEILKSPKNQNRKK